MFTLMKEYGGNKLCTILFVNIVTMNLVKVILRLGHWYTKTSRQKIYRYFSETFCEDWDYRKLNREERITYIMRKYEEFVGRDKIEEAVLKAWELLKPNLNEIDVVNV